MPRTKHEAETAGFAPVLLPHGSLPLAAVDGPQLHALHPVRTFKIYVWEESRKQTGNLINKNKQAKT